MAPRDGSGTYSKPAGTTASDGTAISATPWNTLTTDLGNEITKSLPRDGSAPMTGLFSLSGNAVSALQPVPLQQLQSYQLTTSNVPTGVAFLNGNNIISNTVTATQVQTNSLTPVTQTEGAFTNVVSAATVDLGAQTSRNITITGSTTITSFGTTATPDYKPFRIKFTGSLTLTHTAGQLILPGGQNLALVPGDMIETVQETTGVWRVWMLTRAVAQVDLAAPAITFHKLTNNSGAPNSRVDWTFQTAMLVNGYGQGIYFTNPGSAITCNLAATGLGGLDVGSISATSWYYFYAISNGVSLNIIASTTRPDSGGPTLPTGYTFTAYLGALRTDGSANLVKTLQLGNRTQYIGMIVLASGNPGSTLSAQGLGSFIPPTASRGQFTILGAGGSGNAALAPNNVNYNASVAPIKYDAAAAGMAVNGELILESTNVYIASNGIAATWYVNGWTDRLNAA